MNIIVTKAAPENTLEIQKVFYHSWLSAYPNEEFGITKDDIEDHFKNLNIREDIENEIPFGKNIPPKERLKIIANIVVERILEEQKNGTIKLTVRNNQNG